MFSRATIADVAKQAGVSIATVSRVINQTAPVAEKTAAQVQAAITALEYRPHAAARRLASKKTHTLGLILPEISGHFFAPMLRGIEAGAKENQYDLLIHSTGSKTGASHRLLSEHNTDGLLIFTESLAMVEIKRLYQLGFPILLLHCSPPDGLNIPYVTFENRSGARKLIDHLIEVHGYRQIAFLTGPIGNEDSYWREVGYRESLAAHAIPFRPELIAMGGFDQVEAQVSVTNWLRAGLEFEAIFAGDDEAALGALAALYWAGRRVPHDVALVGFNDLYLSRSLTPPLTTVRAPIETAGYEAVRRLVEFIQTGQPSSALVLPTELVIRRSCGCYFEHESDNEEGGLIIDELDTQNYV